MRRHEALESDHRAPAAHDALWTTLVDVITPLTGAETAAVASVALWAFLHGVVGLERADLLGGKTPLDAAPFGLAAFLAGVQTLSTTVPSATSASVGAQRSDGSTARAPQSTT